MAKKFKKNQPIIATLPTGRVVEGFYIEPYGTDRHSIYVEEYDGVVGGKIAFKKETYGVTDECIDAADENSSSASYTQYQAWLKRATILEERIQNDEEELKKVDSNNDGKKAEKLKKLIERNGLKLDQINKKIEEFEENH